jgi:hypothetical protein
MQAAVRIASTDRCTSWIRVDFSPEEKRGIQVCDLNRKKNGCIEILIDRNCD